MWPANLARDFPRRSRRLSYTLWRGLKGLINAGPAVGQAIRQGQGPWQRQPAGRCADWLHQLASQLFDLVGGPELVQFVMRLGTNTTPLTDEELETITMLLGPEGMRYGDVRVAEGGVLDLIFKYNGNLAFATWHTIHLPRHGRHTRANLPVVVHELVHVYQYEHVGSRYLGEAIYMLIKTRRNCYDYGAGAGLQAAHEAGQGYCDYNREQQARIVQDYFALKRKGFDVTAYEPFMSQLRAGLL